MLASLTHFRRRVGAFIGGFEAGLANRRLKGFQPSRAHLNTLIAAAGPDITARARWLVRNNGYAANAIESWASNVVGGNGDATAIQKFQTDSRRTVEPVSSISNRVSSPKTRILKTGDQRLAHKIPRVPVEIRNLPPQRLTSTWLTRGKTANIFTPRMCTTETGLAGWGARTRTVECRSRPHWLTL